MIEVVLDTETTGLSVAKGHRIVEFGCIELKNQIPTNKNFHCYLNPQRKVSEDAMKVHGYTDEFLSDKKKFSDVADDFLQFIQNKKLIIRNAEFDISHINNELKLVGKQIISKDNVIDTLDIARENGNRIENGKFMFIYQANQSFSIWNNVIPKIDEAVLKILE